MPRQSITFTQKNDEWLKQLVDSKEFTSKSEIINNLIRQARNQDLKINWIRAKLIKAENSDFTDRSKEEILAHSKQMLKNEF